ncbi:Leucine-responsive regulatory protein [Granulosicoccus antarcticus IMCC3135]|uniref:Leucine-responsive regulatory protein n=2 Tax=Granulosicoccus TaxID=437504 RepID=A0A2Z2P2C8_9GAMM|nr:Leucine-responsive regulatory protein [Granulosicoccus antarcticus IMCC3135]
MDSKDRQIVRALQRDGRITNQALAQKVNLSPSPCLRRLRNLEESNVIRGYSAEIDPRKYGLSLLAFISVRLTNHTKETVTNFESQVRLIDEILACYLLTGVQDYLLHVVVKDLDGYDDFIRNRLHSIGCIASIDTSISYSIVKHTAVYPEI